MQRKPARLDSRALFGARAVPLPRFTEPPYPTLREVAPSGERWVHEIKLDGYRTQAHLQQGRPAIYTRRAYDWTRRFQPIADALATLPADDLIMDGEAVVADSRGFPDFALQVQLTSVPYSLRICLIRAIASSTACSGLMPSVTTRWTAFSQTAS